MQISPIFSGLPHENKWNCKVKNCMNLYFVPVDKVVMKDDTRCQTLKFLLTAKVHELQRLESAVKKQIHKMHFQPIPKYQIAASLYKALQHVMELCPNMYSPHSHPPENN